MILPGVDVANILPTDDPPELINVTLSVLGNQLDLFFSVRDRDRLEHDAANVGLSGRFDSGSVVIGNVLEAFCVLSLQGRRFARVGYDADTGVQVLRSELNLATGCGSIQTLLPTGSYTATVNGGLQIGLVNDADGTDITADTDRLTADGALIPAGDPIPSGTGSLTILSEPLPFRYVRNSPVDVSPPEVFQFAGIRPKEQFVYPETVGSGTNLGTVGIEDADLMRGIGDNYTYILELDPAPAENFLAWYDGDRQIGTSEQNVRNSTGAIVRSIKFSRPPDDQGVGIYQLTWRVQDSGGTGSVLLFQ